MKKKRLFIVIASIMLLVGGGVSGACYSKHADETRRAAARTNSAYMLLAEDLVPSNEEITVHYRGDGIIFVEGIGELSSSKSWEERSLYRGATPGITLTFPDAVTLFCEREMLDGAEKEILLALAYALDEPEAFSLNPDEHLRIAQALSQQLKPMLETT